MTRTLTLAAVISCFSDFVLGEDEDASIWTGLQVTVSNTDFRAGWSWYVFSSLYERVTSVRTSTCFSVMLDTNALRTSSSWRERDTTIGDIATEFARKAGLNVSVLNGALFVGTSNTLLRIRATPMLPKAQDSRLEQLLQSRMQVEEFRACFGSVDGIADFIMRESGIPVLVDPRIAKRFATWETPFVQNMTWRNFIWWMSVLNVDAVPTIAERAVRISLKPDVGRELHTEEGTVSNKSSEATSEPAPGAASSSPQR